MCTLSRFRNALLAACLLLGMGTSVSHAQVSTFVKNFETLEADSSDALANDGWIVFGNVFEAGTGTWLYGYGTFPAPNGGNAFSAIDTGQGGVDQGDQQLSIYNDYDNVGEHTTGNTVQANVFIEQTIGAGDVGKTYVLQFDAKLGNLVAPSKAFAFIKTIDPGNNFALTNEVLQETTSIPTTWNTYTISLFIDAGLVGQFLQTGFNSEATNFDPSGVFYDNVVLREQTVANTPTPRGSFTLHQNVPNPFNPATRISFELQRADVVNLRIFDTAGRRVATLLQGSLDAGPHSVNWNGRMSNGNLAAAGIYHYVLETSEGRSSRQMVLLK